MKTEHKPDSLEGIFVFNDSTKYKENSHFCMFIISSYDSLAKYNNWFQAQLYHFNNIWIKGDVSFPRLDITLCCCHYSMLKMLCIDWLIYIQIYWNIHPISSKFVRIKFNDTLWQLSQKTMKHFEKHSNQIHQHLPFCPGGLAFSQTALSF